MVNIQEESCIGCGQCVKDCVANNLRLEDGISHVLQECLLCGHCVAVCPTASVTIPEYDMDDVQVYDEETFRVKPENFLNTVKYRRSIRDYKHKKVERNILEKVMQAGRYTETAVNYQDVSFIVVQDELETAKELIWEGFKTFAERLSKTDPDRANVFLQYYHTYKEDKSRDRLFFNAPVLVVVTADIPLDGGLASANIENMAVAEGLGVLFDGYVAYGIENNREAREWLGIGEKSVVSCMLLGYPNITYRRTAPRRKANILWK